MVKYTEKLLGKGAERKRLTKQLAALVGAVAEDIAKSLPEGATPHWEPGEIVEIRPGLTHRNDPWWNALKVIRVKSNIGETKFLALIVYRRDNKPAVFVADKEPGTSFFLDNDPRRRIEVASAEEYLEFANHIPEIVAGFEKKADELSEILREAFDSLREIANTDKPLFPEFDPKVHITSGPFAEEGKE